MEKITGKEDLLKKFNLPKGVGRYSQFMFQKEREVAKVLKENINKKKITKSFIKNSYFKKISTSDFENHLMLTDLKTWLADESLMRTDKMTMAFGLEQRVPILDHQLVELAMRIPSSYKIKNRREGKMIFKEAMKKYLPKHILESDYKKVWLAPMSEWLRTDLNKFALNILSEDYCPETKKFFDFKGINKMFLEHVNREKYNLNLIWALITFQIWYKKNLVDTF